MIKALFGTRSRIFYTVWLAFGALVLGLMLTGVDPAVPAGLLMLGVAALFLLLALDAAHDGALLDPEERERERARPAPKPDPLETLAAEVKRLADAVERLERAQSVKTRR